MNVIIHACPLSLSKGGRRFRQDFGVSSVEHSTGGGERLRFWLRLTLGINDLPGGLGHVGSRIIR